MLSQNQFPEPNRHIFVFSSSTLSVEDHILSTVGDAVITLPSGVFFLHCVWNACSGRHSIFLKHSTMFFVCYFPVIPDRDPLGITGCLKIKNQCKSLCLLVRS
jgi:hypothetical protein